MKKNAIYILSGLLLSISACEILDVQPNDRIPSSQVFEDRRGLEAAVTGAYQVLQSGALTQDYYILADLAADNLSRTGSKIELRDIFLNRVLSSNIAMERIWNRSYDGINRANNVLEGIDQVPNLSEEAKNQYRGEMLFLRGFHHLNLARMFGGIPLRERAALDLSLESINTPRSTKAQTYAFIVDDLQTAMGLLSTGSDPNQANKAAAGAVLARAQLYNEQWEAAEATASQVLALNHSLVPGTSYADLFDEEKTNSEVLFQVDYTVSKVPNPLTDYMLPTSDDHALGVKARGEVAATTSLFNAYSETDLRRDVTVLKTTDGSLIFPAKYSKPAVPGDDIPLIRLAEVYLIRAEARAQQDNKLQAALEDLNAIRERAGLSSLSSSNKQEILDAIQLERRRELAFEGHRWFDLARTGRLEAVLREKGTFEGDYQSLFPIPQSEIDTNELISSTDQNPGY